MTSNESIRINKKDNGLELIFDNFTGSLTITEHPDNKKMMTKSTPMKKPMALKGKTTILPSSPESPDSLTSVDSPPMQSACKKKPTSIRSSTTKRSVKKTSLTHSRYWSSSEESSEDDDIVPTLRHPLRTIKKLLSPRPTNRNNRSGYPSSPESDYEEVLTGFSQQMDHYKS
mmetsp:Transcript_15897/g.39467  ORF Transcript_15897/g.39467 Transcript_15897/m.39467 type:complete len:172 (-) Transcript_15897:256-771(-)